MVTVILPPTATLETAAAELRKGAQAPRQGIIDRALYDLLTAAPAIVRVSGAYLVPSSSRGGLVHRVDDLAGCSCEAGRSGRSCRHAVALELVEQAQTHTMPALGKDRISRARAEDEAARLALLECF